MSSESDSEPELYEETENTSTKMESILQPPQSFKFENNLSNVTSGNLSREWEKWKKSYKIYCEACELSSKSNKTQINILLHIIGEKCRDVAEQFQGDYKTTEELLLKFDAFFIPKKNLAVERQKFFKRDQEELESAEQYIFELNKMAVSCEFKDLQDDLVCSRLICGLKNVALSERLLREPEITLGKALDICRLAEMSRMQALNMKSEKEDHSNQVHEITQENMRDSEVHWIGRGRPRPAQHQSGASPRPGHRPAPPRHDPPPGAGGGGAWPRTGRHPDAGAPAGPSRAHAIPVSHRGDNRQRQFVNKKCGNCGRVHKRNECPAYGQRCVKCDRMNHYARMCRVYAVHEDSTDQEMQDVLDEDSEMSDWLIERDSKSGVVLHDRLMTDAAIGSAPIKTEHSYSLHSDVESAPNSPHHTKVDDMEDECYPTIPASAWSRRRSSDCPEVKSEPKSEPDSPASSCPPSPTPGTPVTHLDYVIDHTTGTIHMPQAVLQKVGAAGVPQLLLSAAPRLANSLSSNKLSIKVTSSGASGFNLPPTPPSSLSSSDSEGALSPAHEASAAPPATPAPTRRSHLYVSHHSRQPINTPLISSQPKGSTGTLVLTEEEKRTLLAEGYPVPTRLPLTKAEEKSLKKIRRKIKNKISAQESRRKKKEYMDQLERKVEMLISENTDYRKRVDTLEQKNASLLSQLAALQSLVTRGARK